MKYDFSTRFSEVTLRPIKYFNCKLVYFVFNFLKRIFQVRLNMFVNLILKGRYIQRDYVSSGDVVGKIILLVVRGNHVTKRLLLVEDL